MQEIIVDSRTFVFPDGWLVMKYDDTPYYRTKFEGHTKRSKGWKREMDSVDLVATNPSAQEPTMFLIESKDYRMHPRTKKITPTEEYVKKVLDTLTGLLPTVLCSESFSNGEDILAAQIRSAKKLRLVYQFEQPTKHSKLYPRAFDIADMQQEIRRELKVIDPHALVIDEASQYKVDWMVR